MIIVDTSVWIDHLKSGDAVLADLLGAGRILAHSFVTGELALGSLRQRGAVLESLRDLPQAIVARDDEVMMLIEREQLYGRGIGFVDAHLLAAARLTSGSLVWTRDRRLRQAATQLGLSAELS
ncbi:type II toxin-antitoxin system VapC family toxin [Microvirga sp. VF16]|uniref:type II toxin-antitoxin system VapC family toxin n=1 Tax=Microvirga sp. VF16 TaxID=2807101 RepID=UPI00193D8F21|nr:type II toxin-antitoxin system VapC family toxin [Microvirga sp. VF16]QRM33937.1 type II toxin-antitoxin system VapC family toxin [Microvirga sp. VF16]